ncbi:hypothetical protein MGYG_06708 [Nannizzia gypsea CBS 118893]|uniref:HNH nuclease domain-containing protein n=1 Tax=Arthroderma gypseum (strain ATCC MYA-4604 / CBS 118893) TaxID=535722 RepID=E4V0Z6_ARTGP|nr:hypothetical protein MGYG_06708 [Nannizzia gypsea CBS 118893]EFR03711.1 hypothetical protein MGYG_06708 [Nannizzia gypsea CBS 118893]
MQVQNQIPVVIETVSHRAKGIQAIKNRPNIHIGIHYLDQIKEYGVANNYSVLVGEDKHRDYKNLIYRTNHRDIEKVLLLQESFKRTLQLILQGAFSEEEPRITTQLLLEQEDESSEYSEVAHIIPHSLTELRWRSNTMFDTSVAHLIDGPKIDSPSNTLTLTLNNH